MNKDVMKRAMIGYVRECCRRDDNPYSPEQWVSVMNSYARHLDTGLCAANADITPLEAALLYCRFSIVLTEEALHDSLRHGEAC